MGQEIFWLACYPQHHQKERERGKEGRKEKGPDGGGDVWIT
jgi:hypothetical protein